MLDSFSELNVCVGFQFYISVILEKKSMQYSKLPVFGLIFFFLENNALRKLFVQYGRVYCPQRLQPPFLQFGFVVVYLFVF